MPIRGNFIDHDTDEYYENCVLRTQEEIEGYKKYQKILEKKAMIDEEYRKNGAFVWLIYHSEQVLDLGITPDQLTKLIYISTFIGYDNKLKAKSIAMRKIDMQKILDVSERTFKSFWHAITSADILRVGDDDGLYLNDSIFMRGKVKRKTIPSDEYKIRLYKNSIQKLYKQSKVTEHKFLSYLFQAIPYINIDYNIISHNPQERDLSLIQPMQMTEYCTLVGYDPENARKLKTKMKSLTINGRYVFSFVDNNDGLFCYVNPYVCYAGNRWDEVKVLGKFDRRADKKHK